MSLVQNNKEIIYRPNTINELEQIINSTKEKLTFVAGATDLMVQQDKWKSANNLVDLKSVKEISEKIEARTDGVLIGAAVPMSDLMVDATIKEKFLILVDACRQIGSVQIQNRATLGGNIANASPAGDSLPVLNVVNADIWIGPQNNGEFEKLKVDQLMTGPGETRLNNNCYISYIFIPFPKQENLFWYFRKVGQRQALAISKLSLAVLGWKNGKKIEEIRISAGSVSPIVRRASKTEEILNARILDKELIEKARKSIEEEVTPITDIRSNAEYRKRICGELLREALYNQLSFIERQ